MLKLRYRYQRLLVRPLDYRIQSVVFGACAESVGALLQFFPYFDSASATMNGAPMKTHLLAVFFYGGPDQIIPLQTGLAALIAVLVMFWNKLLIFFHRLFLRFKPKPKEMAPADVTVPVDAEQNRDQS